MRRSFVGLVIAAWATLGSASTLPAPDGKHAIGVVRAEFVDSSRRLDADDPDSGPRRLPAIVWYPAQGRAVGNALYLEAEVAAVGVPAIARNFRYKVEDLH